MFLYFFLAKDFVSHKLTLNSNLLNTQCHNFLVVVQKITLEPPRMSWIFSNLFMKTLENKIWKHHTKQISLIYKKYVQVLSNISEPQMKIILHVFISQIFSHLMCLTCCQKRILSKALLLRYRSCWFFNWEGLISRFGLGREERMEICIDLKLKPGCIVLCACGDG